MKTLGYVQDKIRTMKDVSLFGVKKEIKELPKLLDDDEELIYITSGLLNDNTWLVALTDSRIMFLDKGLIYGLKTKNVDLDMLNSIEFKSGMFLGDLSVWTGGEQIIMKSITNSNGRMLERLTLKQLKIHKRNLYAPSIPWPVEQPIQPANKVDEEKPKNELDSLIENINKLAQLKEQGVITEEEFTKMKAKYFC